VQFNAFLLPITTHVLQALLSVMTTCLLYTVMTSFDHLQQTVINSVHKLGFSVLKYSIFSFV